MADFSPTDAAFTGFRIVRERPRVLAFWIVLQVLSAIVFSTIVISVAGPALMTVQRAGLQSLSSAAAIAFLRQIAPAYSVILAISLVLYPTLYAAMARSVLRPQDDRFGYLRFGSDELRQLGLMLCVMALFFALYIVSILILVPVVAVGALLGRMAGGQAALSGLAAVAGVTGIAIVWLTLGIRLSLASPLTFASRKVSLAASWTLTRGHFWPILGTYTLAVALACVVYVLGLAIIVAIVVVIGGGMGALSAFITPDVSSLRVYMTPMRVITLILSGVLGAMIWPVMLTPPAAIYRSLAGATSSGA